MLLACLLNTQTYCINIFEIEINTTFSLSKLCHLQLWMVLLKSMTGRVVAPTSKGAHMPTQLEFTAKGWEEGRERGDDGGDTCSYRM